MTQGYVLFTSDTHFHHAGILKHGRNKFFDSVEEMNEELVQSWNAVVGPNDRVHHLGDFSFGNRTKTTDIVLRLNGEIHLTRGNHDPSSAWFDNLFASVAEYRTIRVNDQKIILSHYPFLTWDQAHYGAWHLHGHCHHQLEPTTQPRLDVGVDGAGYRFAPLTFEEIATIMADRVYTPVDHHKPSEVAS